MSAFNHEQPLVAHRQRWLLGGEDRISRLLRRRPWLLDVVVVAAVMLFGVPSMVSGGLGRAGGSAHSAGVLALAAVLFVVPLVWRRRAPVLAFAATLILILVEWSLGIYIGTAVTILVTLYGVAAHASTRALLWSSASTLVGLTVGVFTLWPSGPHLTAAFLLMLGTCSAGVAAGLAMRTERAYLSAVADRAEWLETERVQREQLGASAERARVAREMHDIVGHHVSIIIGLADGAAALASDRHEQTAEPLQLIADTGRRTLDDLRRLLGVLRDSGQDPLLRPQPGIVDLEALLPTVRGAGLTVMYRTSGELEGLDEGLQLVVYRIVQEALTNTLKFAGSGAEAQVSVVREDGRVRVHVSDLGPADPNGRRPRTHRSSEQGLVGIRERAGLYGGTVTAGPVGTGWSVDVVLTDLAGRDQLAGLP